MIRKNSNEGHRKRLRDRFLQSGLDGFLDYEIIELLLTLGTPRKDCKQQAKAAISEFRGLRGVLDATLEELRIIHGIGSSNAFGIKLFQAISERYHKETLSAKIAVSTPAVVVQYLREHIGREKKELFVAVYLNTKNEIIKNEVVSIGILNASLVHPREVYGHAISNSAASIIVAHNHPSGDVTPSHEDILVTKQLKDAGEILGIHLLDHLIIGNREYMSFKEQGLL